MKFAPMAACALAGLFSMLLPLGAFAVPGEVHTTVNLREGAGTTTPVLGKIPNGSAVEVVSCDGDWCQITWQGKKGYIIATSLAQGAAPPSTTGAVPRGGPPPGGPPVAGYPGRPPMPPPGYGGPPPGYGGPPPGYGGPPPGYGGPPPGYGGPPAGYVLPPGYVPPPGYLPPPYYYGRYYAYGPYWRRRGWYRRHW